MNIHETLYQKGIELLSKAGYTVSPGSICEPEFVLVFSREIVRNSYGHPQADYIATVRDGNWNEQVSSTLR
jgi:hypothetical protein